MIRFQPKYQYLAHM